MTQESRDIASLLDDHAFGAEDAAGLQSLADQYPYFAPLQFLLLKRLDPATEAYRRQYQKALLYYHDPLQLEYLLHREKFDTELPKFLESIGEAPNDERETSETGTSTETAPSDPEPPDTIVSEPANAESLPIQSFANETGNQPGVTPSADAPAATEPIAFEPFHTVDYFASQGIKLRAEDAGKDKLGRQLKSFTDWLKTMKRLPEPESAAAAAPSDQRVHNLAVHSVEGTDIHTEAMAEVWLKQGNKAKAVEVYEKLSLLNPSKKAYFAAKIQNLNE